MACRNPWRLGERFECVSSLKPLVQQHLPISLIKNNNFHKVGLELRIRSRLRHQTAAEVAHINRRPLMRLNGARQKYLAPKAVESIKLAGRAPKCARTPFSSQCEKIKVMTNACHCNGLVKTRIRGYHPTYRPDEIGAFPPCGMERALSSLVRITHLSYQLSDLASIFKLQGAYE